MFLTYASNSMFDLLLWGSELYLGDKSPDVLEDLFEDVYLFYLNT